MPRSKKTRESLSRQRIVEASLGLVEREGLAGFSFRKLAAELHCEAMSIYHYFPSKSHLMDALVDRAVGEMPPIPEASLPWIDRLRIIAHDWRRVVTARPSLFIFLATHRMNTPSGLAWLNGMLGFFSEAGLGEEEGARLFRAFGYYLMGAGLDETAGYARGPSTVEPVPEAIMQREYANVVAAGRWFRPDAYDKTFELGLELMLEAIERRIGSAGRDGEDPVGTA